MGIFRQFPYSNFHDMNMDEIIKIMREMQDEWEETKNEWASTKNFIENYFANLDITDELLDALATMIENGTFNEVVDPVIIAAVGAWLTDNITPTTPALDRTLLVNDCAAESAATGRMLFSMCDAVANVKTQNYHFTQADLRSNEYWDTTNNGVYTYQTNTRFKCSPRYYLFESRSTPYQPIIISVSTGYTINVLQFDENFEYLGSMEFAGNNGRMSLGGVKYISFNVRRTDNGDISSDTFTVDIVNVMFDDIPEMEEHKTYTVTDVDGIIYGQLWDISDGHISWNVNFARTDLYRISDIGGIATDIPSRVLAVFFDADREYLGYIDVYGSTTTASAEHLLKMVPESAAYVGFTIYKPDNDYVESITSITFHRFNSSGLLTADANTAFSYDYHIIQGVVANALGTIKLNANYYACLLANIDFDGVYVNYMSSLGCVYYDRNNTLISSSPTHIDDDHGGEYYPRPSGAYYCVVLFRSEMTGDDGVEIAQFLACHYSDKELGTLKGLKIFNIGDSIAWLNNVANYGLTGIKMIMGYQDYIAMLGARIFTRAISGGAYATGTGSPSIYTDIAGDTPDFTEWDAVILSAGLNDMREGVTIGSNGTYSAPNITTTNFIGAIGAMVKLIRDSNPKIRIFICTPLPTNHSDRTFDKLMLYRDAIIEAAEFWDLSVIDWSTKSARDIPYNPTTLSYDGTHPNNAGMKILGEVTRGQMLAELS